ncbi:MAG: ABC transporter [Rhodovulum sulfidophilum]|uniref:ABC transporter n=1 Tax=Rhodovulum sulfidophilum TaxID=35806 RepID=A0A2W5PP09_RHOSU|nr:MAG: ABC transporter [Rhodovulum sulfidophilum]
MQSVATIAETAQPRGRAGGFSSDRRQLWIGVALILATGLLPSLLGNSYWEHTFQLVNVYIAVAILQSFLFVDAGQKSFGQGAILGLGAYGFAIASGLHGLPLLIGALVGIGAASLGGLIFALPALRVQGFHLGFVTMSAAIVFPQLLNQFDGLTRGINGISMTLPGLAAKPLPGLSWLTLLLTLVPIAGLFLHYRMRGSRLGRRMRVAAESPEAARSLGIVPGLMRALAFLLTAALAGLCGVLYVPAVGFISPQGFLLDLSFVFFFAVVVGGRGQLLGPIVGIWIIFILPSVFLVQLVEYKPLVYGLITLATVLLFPDGVVGAFEARRRRARRGGGEGAFRLEAVNEALAAIPPAPRPAPDAPPILSLSGATKRFGKVVAVEGIDFELRPGEIHGLVGANGSGKTSLLNVLSGFNRLNEGRYRLGGRDVTRRSAPAIARMGVARTFQNPRIFPFFSTWNNIRVGIDARHAPLDPSMRALADRFAETMADDSPTLLSHGQRRLLEVVRVIMKDSDVVLFDEPAAGLSPREREGFGTLVRHLSRTLGKAVVLVEHDLDLVWDIADRITVLETGRVVASGAPADIVREPAVRALFVGGSDA